MRKINLLLAAIGIVVMTSCTNEEYVGESQATSQVKKNEAIVFSGGASSLTRADLYGSDAAAKLGGKFVVYGTKHIDAAEAATDANDAIVFNNFQVAWTASTAGTTESNSSDWEYVGLQAYDAEPATQGIKYWDYDADNGHTFYAFSYHRSDTEEGITYPANKTGDDVYVEKVTEDGSSLYNKGYSVTIKKGATLNNLYFSDRVEVSDTKYDNTVSFTFRNIGAKVRVGFYETIPGYTVKIDKFYIDEDATAAVTDFKEMKNGKTNGFYASLQNIKTSVDQTLNVTYYNETTATQVINRPKLTNPADEYGYTLKLGSGTGIIGKELATSAATPTWVAGKTVDKYYIPVYPFEGNTNPMLVKLDFTLTADDGSPSPDVIHVKGARAIVPTEFVKWKSNFAYTYIFKISDKSNGTTGAVDPDTFEPTDPTGLKAITFDAIVVDVAEELQQTITSVSTNSITTYAGGEIVNEYKKGKAIYVAITDNSSHNVITPEAIGVAAKNAQVYKLGRAASEAEVLALLNGSPISGLTKDVVTAEIKTAVPLVDGTNPPIANVMFTPSEAGTYAYVYCTTPYVATTYKAATGDYDSGTTYYLRSGDGTDAHPYVYYAVSVPNTAAYTENIDKLFVVDEAGTTGVYDVKVIKVQD